MHRTALMLALLLTIVSAVSISRSGATTDGTINQLPCDWCDERKDCVKIEYRGARADFIESSDCIQLNEQGIKIYRYLPALRRVRRVQRWLAPGATVPTAFPDSPEIAFPHEDVLPGAIVAAGIAVNDDGQTLYVCAAVATETLVFDRNPETGVLTFRTIRTFPTESDRAAFLADRSKK